MPFSKPYPELRAFIGDPSSLEEMVQDASRVVEREIGKQKGFVGVTLRGSFRLAQTLAPHYVERMIAQFFEPVLGALTPFFHAALDRDVRLEAHFSENAPAVVEALLEITDAYSAQDRDGPLKSAYKRLRPRLSERMQPSMGPLGALVDRHLASAWQPGVSPLQAGSRPA